MANFILWIQVGSSLLKFNGDLLVSLEEVLVEIENGLRFAAILNVDVTSPIKKKFSIMGDDSKIVISWATIDWEALQELC
jgi:hypothetical protein